MNLLNTAVPVLIFIGCWIVVFVFIIFILVRFSKVPNLITRRLYFDENTTLEEREEVLMNARKGSNKMAYYDYYVVLPGEELPVFRPRKRDLEKCEYLIIEYLICEPKTVNSHGSDI